MTAVKKFLSDFQNQKRTLESLEQGLTSKGLFLGKGESALEVALVSSETQPQTSKIRKAYKKRKRNRANPVLLTVIQGGKASVCGPSGDNPPIYKAKPLKIVESFCRSALNQPDRHKALEFCHQFLPSIEEIPGIHNKTLFSSHHLKHGIKKRLDWSQAQQKAQPIQNLKDKDLLTRLGFYIEQLDNLTYVLKSKDKKRALAVLLDPTEFYETSHLRFNDLSPVEYAMKKADQENMPYVLIVQDHRIRLYQRASEYLKSRHQSYIECQSNLLRQEDLGYLWLIFSAEALHDGGSLSEILENSQRFQEDVKKDLKERIYNKIIPHIANGIMQAMRLEKPSSQDLDQIYEMTLTVLFRLLFIAHAEDKDLLPYKTNAEYQTRSLKEKAKALAQNKPFEESQSHHWKEIASLWKAIDKGNQEWGIIAYNGGLFSEDSTIGKKLAQINVTNSFFGPALKDLLLIPSETQDLALLDFRFLGPREFGTIYEGLLESNLVQAAEDLTLDRKNVYVPLKSLQKEKVVSKGHVYLQNQSGARKATGSYYTKNFIVEHLLDQSLEPALKQHFERLDHLNDHEASKAFFDFFVADIAMGSGHFLVIAVDRIEKVMTEYLKKRPLSGVQSVLDKVRARAEENLSDMSDGDFDKVIDDRSLLARHIAKHCIYGVDNNDLAVQLAKLSLWSHTFIPGLPLSYFDHNLRCGDSLVGIGTLKEVQEELQSEDTQNISMPLIDVSKLMQQIKEPLQEMKQLADLDVREIKQNQLLQNKIGKSLKPVKALFDIAIAQRINKEKWDVFKINKWTQNQGAIAKSTEAKEAQEKLEGLKVLHFPIAFPEVFLRERAGFDVIIGNPPWEQINVEKHAFWARYFPGLRGLSQKDREAQYQLKQRNHPELEKKYQLEVSTKKNLNAILKSTNSKNLISGKSDLYKYFSWRFWNLIAEQNGFIGVVLKGTVSQSKGLESFRKEIFQKSQNVYITTLVNHNGWVFENVDGIRISLLSLEISKNNNIKHSNIYINGPFLSDQKFQIEKKQNPLSFTKNQLESWTDSYSLPALPQKESLDVFLRMRKALRLDSKDKNASWIVYPDTELNTTNQKGLMDLNSKERPKGFWPIFTGKSFNIWQPDTGIHYAYADPQKVIKWLYDKRINASRNQNSAHSEFSTNHIQDQNTLPCFKSRIAFRDIGSADRPRTIHASIIPPKIFLVHTAPYLLFPRGDKKDEAFLLGVLSSIPLDWYARLFVSATHLSFFILNTFPVPRPSRKDPLWKRTVKLAGRLACPDRRFASWAKAVGVQYGQLDEDTKNDMIYELDAVVALMYGLSEKQLIHIFETFHRTWDYESRLQAVLKHYKKWKNTLK